MAENNNQQNANQAPREEANPAANQQGAQPIPDVQELYRMQAYLDHQLALLQRPNNNNEAQTAKALGILAHTSKQADIKQAYPGMVVVQPFLTQLETFKGISAAEANAKLRQRAQAKELPSSDGFAFWLVCTYDDEDKCLAAQIMLETTGNPKRRLKLFNTLMLQRMGESDLLSNSDLVEHMEVTLFPPISDELIMHNRTILLHTRRKVEAAAGGKPKKFRSPVHADFDEGVSGAGILQVVDSPPYGLHVNTALQDSAYQANFQGIMQKYDQELQTLRQQISEQQYRLQQFEARPPPPPQATAYQPHQQYPSYQSGFPPTYGGPQPRSRSRGQNQGQEQQHGFGAQGQPRSAQSRPRKGNDNTRGSGFCLQADQSIFIHSGNDLPQQCILHEQKQPRVSASQCPVPLDTAEASFPPTLPVSGGEMSDCLDDTDIDPLIKPLLGKHVVPSRMFHDVVHGSDEFAGKVANQIRQLVEENHWLIMPVLARHHWATALISKFSGSGELQAVILDSAPGPITKKDFLRHFKRIGVPWVEIRPHCRQPQDSNECGLHVILMALYFSVTPRSRLPPVSLDQFTLNDWRDQLFELKERGEPAHIKGLLQACPKAAQWFSRRVVKRNSSPSKESAPANSEETSSVTAARTVSALRPSEPQPRGAGQEGHDKRFLFPAPTTEAKEKVANPNAKYIDVDGDEATLDCVGLSADYLRRSGIETNHPAIKTWFKDTIDSSNKEIDKGNRLREAQLREAATPQKRRDLLASPRFPKVAIRKSMSTIEVRLKDAPHDVRTNGLLWKRLNELAASLLSVDKSRRQLVEEDDIFNAPHGTYINTALMDRFIDSFPIKNGWTVIKPIAFQHFANNNRTAELPKRFEPNVALVIWNNSHYTLATFSKGKIEYRDSLIGDRRESPSNDWIHLLGRFRALLRSHGYESDEQISLEPCPLQREPDCGIQAINNLAACALGARGHLSRSLIRQAYLLADRSEAPELWKRIWPAPQPSVPPQRPPAPTPVCVTAERPPTDVTPSPKASCCARPVLFDGFCAWHLPAILNQHSRTRCSERNSVNKPCKQMALGLGGVRHCFDHLTQADRNILTRTLEQGPTAERHSVPASNPSITVGDGTHPVSHNEIDAFLNCLGGENMLEMDASAPSRSRFTSRCKILKRPSKVAKATIDMIARWCETCNSWHSTEDIPVMPLPRVGVQYFQIRAISASDFETTPECDEDAGEDEGLIPAAGIDPDRECINSTCIQPVGSLKANCADKWFIHPPGRPPTIHQLVWSRLSESTRKRHRAWLYDFKNCPEELKSSSVPFAAVEIVLRKAREHHWSWPTISSALSTIASALENLTIYTNCAVPIKIRGDKYFSDACANALSKAKIASTESQRSVALSKQHLDELANGLKGNDSWLLLQLTWYLAARVGDLRKLLISNIHVDDKPDSLGNVPVTVLFTDGKGAYFWGPYAAHAKIPSQVATVLREFLRLKTQRRAATLFSVSDQDMLSKAIRGFPGHTLRSIRKGSLTYLADCGATDSQLQMLSGHKRRETLLRYLDWGQRSSEAKDGAEARAKLTTAAEASQPVSGAGFSHATISSKRPMPMGIHSGLNGYKGQRVPAPPTMFRLNAPSRAELGLPPLTNPERPELTPDKYPLHVKNVGCIDLEALQHSVQSHDLKEALNKALSFVQSPKNYGINWPPLSPSEVTASSFTPEQVVTMLEGGKLRPLAQSTAPTLSTTGLLSVTINDLLPLPADTPIRCAAKGFTVVQEAKQRLRPVLECANNSCILKEELPELHYPSRRERRAAIASAKYFMQFDFSAFYDQIALDESVLNCFIIRSKTPIVVNERPYSLFALTREPMGSSHSAHVAQTITWAILEPLLLDRAVKVFTTIDNVGIASDDPDAFVRAITMFLRRCRTVNATINDIEKLPASRKDILEAGQMQGQTFLGEVYDHGFVANTKNNVDKLKEAFVRLQEALEGRASVTKRQIASAIGLWTWMANTIDQDINQHHDIIRLYSQIASLPIPWDDPMSINANMVGCCRRAFGPTLLNTPVRPHSPALPSFNNKDYQAVIIVDACSTGFAAIAHINGTSYEMKGGWRNYIQHSAWTEPMAALEAIRWARRLCSGRIALVTDHISIASGQRRPLSGNGGFSKAFHLNNIFKELYQDGQDHQIFYVEGPYNPADAPSRDTRIGDYTTSKILTDRTFPPLASFFHPYSAPIPRPWWNV